MEEGPGQPGWIQGQCQCALVCSSTARSADGREIRDRVPQCQILVQSQLWGSSQDHNPAKQILHQLSVKWILMCAMRKEAEVFAQAPVFYLNCSQAKSRALGLCWDLVRPRGRGAGPVWAGKM